VSWWSLSYRLIIGKQNGCTLRALQTLFLFSSLCNKPTSNIWGILLLWISSLNASVIVPSRLYTWSGVRHSRIITTYIKFTINLSKLLVNSLRLSRRSSSLAFNYIHIIALLIFCDCLHFLLLSRLKLVLIYTLQLPILDIWFIVFPLWAVVTFSSN
jgi:hypothetical protein